MKSIKQRLDENYIIGCIKFKNKYDFYLMPIAWWILNHEKYDPSYKSEEWEYVFRNNILNVLNNQIEDYLNSIQEDKISETDYKSINENFSKEDAQVYFFIDFDKKIYVSSFSDIEVEDYLPDDTWVGKYENPLDHIPKNILEFN